MITEELIEDLDLPDYGKWHENIWTDDYSWDYLLADWVDDCSEKGIRIDEHTSNRKRSYPKITFDLYGNQCASNGDINDFQKFYEVYKNRLLSISPVYTQALYEDLINVTWGETRNNWLDITVEAPYNLSEDDTFTSGIFSGTSVYDLMNSEVVPFSDFERCITEIISDLHADLLKTLYDAYEYDTSEERYKEWILEEIEDAVRIQKPTNENNLLTHTAS